MTDFINTWDDYVEYKKKYGNEILSNIVTLEFLKNHGDNNDINLHRGIISIRKDITPEFVMDNLDLPWWWNLIYTNPNFTLEFVENNPHHKDMYFLGLSDNPNLTFEFLFKHKDSSYWLYDGDDKAYFADFRWRYKYRGISRNPNFDISWYLNLPDKKWSIKDFVFSNNFKPEWLDIAPLNKEDENTWFLPYLAGKIPNELFFQYFKEKKFVTECHFSHFVYTEADLLYKSISNICYIYDIKDKDKDKEIITFLETIFIYITNHYELKNHEKFMEFIENRNAMYKTWNFLTIEYGRKDILTLMIRCGYDTKSIEFYKEKYNM